MTSEDRIFLRRHLSAFRGVTDRNKALNEAIRQGHAWGIKQTHMAEYFGVHISRVMRAVNRSPYNLARGHCRALRALDLARERLRIRQSLLGAAKREEREALRKIREYR